MTARVNSFFGIARCRHHLPEPAAVATCKAPNFSSSRRRPGPTTTQLMSTDEAARAAAKQPALPSSEAWLRNRLAVGPGLRRDYEKGERCAGFAFRAGHGGAMRRWSGAVMTLAFGMASAHAAPPQRIVSLNLCVDQILVDLVARERIAAVTHLAADASVSAVPEKFARIPAIRGAAEEVLARDPDLVIAGVYSTPATVDLLRRLGRRVVVVPMPQTIDGVRALITTIAETVEAPAAGQALVAAMDARLAATTPTPTSSANPSALIYQINNYVTGRGSLLDEALGRAGFRNAGGDVTIYANGKTSLENIVAAPPDVLILASNPDDYTTSVGDNLRHPALARLRARIPSVVLPWSLSLCGTHHIATAIERLAAARARLLATIKAGP
jgi:iron complex transport system substrate-binding protein